MEKVLANRLTISPQEARNLPKTDAEKRVESSYENVMEITKDDPNFLKTGLVKVHSSEDSSIEYVLNEPDIKALYEKEGQKCINLLPSKLEDAGADMDAIVHSGELEELKKSKLKAIGRSNWKKGHYVLRKSGVLTCYTSKESSDQDPLGVTGEPKPEKFKSMTWDPKMGTEGVFVIHYKAGAVDKFDKFRGIGKDKSLRILVFNEWYKRTQNLVTQG